MGGDEIEERRERDLFYLPLACPVELLRTIFVPNIVFCVQARRADARVS
jgi:hypothetical protein